VQRNADFPINGPILKVQAEKFAKQLGHENFTCNNGWLDRFKSRHNILYAIVSGEAPSVDSKTASEWVTSVWVGCQQGYSEEDIYSADETGVLYNMTPDSTFKFKGEKCVGRKMSKNCLTVLICANMTGTDKKRLFVIGKSQTPHCFKNVKKLPVEYAANKKAWMTSDIFQQYISKWGSRVSSDSLVSDYGLDDRAIGVRSPAGARDFSLSSVSRPALGPTQPPLQWVPGVKRGQGVMLTTHPNLVPRS
jgi:hypothetical protein